MKPKLERKLERPEEEPELRLALRTETQEQSSTRSLSPREAVINDQTLQLPLTPRTQSREARWEIELVKPEAEGTVNDD